MLGPRDRVATYAVGDVQGCLEPLTRLMRAIDFAPARDRVWLLGDLVNRGPDSLGVLRWALAGGGAVNAVLGNHDLHLLAVAAGVRHQRPNDTLAPVLAAPDRHQLLDWLAARPLAVREGGHLLVHAGLLPAWSPEAALARAAELHQGLTGDRQGTLRQIYEGQVSSLWRDDLAGAVRLATIAAALTMLRACERDGAMRLDFHGPLEAMPAGCRAWFDMPGLRGRDVTVVFGHWAALGLRHGPGYLGLDSGCAYGRELTALRLDDGQLFGVPARV
jgi:bis(5'-nucleosyl)-tetraphosphatase (symmetrical)